MKTIKTKLFLMFISLMAGFVVCSILLNTLFLENYYIYTSSSSFKQAANRINRAYDKGPGELDKLLKSIDRSEGISCAIYDKNQTLKYSSFPSSTTSEKVPSEIEQLIRQDTKFIQKNFAYGIVQMPGYDSRDLAFVSRLNNGELLVMKKPLKGVIESTATANQFFMLSSLLIILLGSAVIYWFSKKITRPIIDMSNVAGAIANLDFSHRVEIDSQDEIGNLGRSINMTSEKLSRSIEAMREDVDRRKQLVRNMSHELKTPIGVIKGYAEGLKFGVADEPQKISRYCDVIASECDRMDVMVKDMLKLSLLESGSLELKPVLIDSQNLFERLIERFSPLLKEKEIEIQVDRATGLEIKADYDLVEQALSNFLLNALHYVNDDKLIILKAESTQTGVKLSVFNSGERIAQEDRARLWDVFFKADQARSREYGGHGLGLSIVKSIADAHGGGCGVDNIDNGVLFYLIIPNII